MNNSQKKIIRDLHSNSRELHDSWREKAQFSLTQLYPPPRPFETFKKNMQEMGMSHTKVHPHPKINSCLELANVAKNAQKTL